MLCDCIDARDGCANETAGQTNLCADCHARGCRSRFETAKQLKNDLMSAAMIVDAFADDCIGPRHDLRELALRLREAAPTVLR